MLCDLPEAREPSQQIEADVPIDCTVLRHVRPWAHVIIGTEHHVQCFGESYFKYSSAKAGLVHA